jgi:thiamine kinase-like enzyme
VMKIYQLYYCTVVFLLCIVTGSFTQENDAIYNGFQQFLGTVHSYECEQVSGGLSSNVQYLCVVNDKKYIVRMLNEPLPIRQSEVLIHVLAASKNIAPTIHYYDTNGYTMVIMDCIDGNTLLLEQACRRDVLDIIAHNVRTIAQFDSNLLVDTNKKDLFAETVCRAEKIKNQCDEILDSMITQALCKLESVNQAIESAQHPLVVNHHDLHPRNIFFTDNHIMIIDWERAAINYELYDLAIYSVYSCLDEDDDHYLLTKYLQRVPSCSDLYCFTCLKLIMRVHISLDFFTCTPHSPACLFDEPIKEFKYYMAIFAQDTNTNSPEFLYAIGISLLQDFFVEYKNFKNDMAKK